MTDILTVSRLAMMRRCPKQHYYRYELGLSRIRTVAPLRIGSAFHLGLELYNTGSEPATAIIKAVAGYEGVPDWAVAFDWKVESETVRQLLVGHFWRYENDNIEIIAVEQSFGMPLVNPHTGRSSRTFVLGGKIDAIARLPDGRLVVVESKTCGESIDTGSDYWLRLRYDPQISQYVLAARALGYNVETVLYDAIRKPTISALRATPSDKRKFKKDGQLYANQREEDETPEAFGDRLLTDIGDRPDYYFQRHEIPRLEDELVEFQVELWYQAKQLAEARRHGRWFRNVGRWTCGTCEFANICMNGVRVTSDNVPSGFHILGDVNPELTMESSHDPSTNNQTNGQLTESIGTTQCPARR